MGHDDQRRRPRGLARWRRPGAPSGGSNDIDVDASPVETFQTNPAYPLAGDDAFDGHCNICGEVQRFVRDDPSMREGYRCRHCNASLRYQGQAEAILFHYARDPEISSIVELVEEPAFGSLSVWEPGSLGPFREPFARMPGYVMSGFWPDVRPGEERDGVRCEDIMELTFASGSLDLVITSDVFEHVRHPALGFREVHRVLRPGGHHIFSIPVQLPLRAATTPRIDVSAAADVHLLPPQYHYGHVVYNDFGLDLIDELDGIGFDTEVRQLDCPSPIASRLVTFCSTRR